MPHNNNLNLDFAMASAISVELWHTIFSASLEIEDLKNAALLQFTPET